MSTYAFLDTALVAVMREETYSADWYAACVAVNSPKVERLRLLVTDAQPALTPMQVVVRGPYVIESARVRVTWVVREKTTNELEAESLQAEKAQIVGYLTELQTQIDITNAQRGAMTTNQRLNTLENDTHTAMKGLKYLLRQAKRAT